MKEFELKYGCNPNQKPSRIYMKNGAELPVEILCGRPGYINFLDAFNSWQLVSELKRALGCAAATSFKHVSPTSAAIGIPMSAELKKACFVDGADGLDGSELATAYARARGTDRCSSFRGLDCADPIYAMCRRRSSSSTRSPTESSPRDMSRRRLRSCAPSEREITTL